MRKRRKLIHAADRVVDAIASHKVEMLAGAIVTTVLLISAAIALWVVGDGEWLTRRLAEAGGYVAILATVLGIPALCYAMVTDRSVDALNAATFENMVERLTGRLTDWAVDHLPQDHHMQLFWPNAHKTLLLPAFDPDGLGPKEGWEIDPAAPQAVTGSAWVRNQYYWAIDSDLSNAKLRLTHDQQRRFADITGVAAAPVQDMSGRPLAVLTILARRGDPPVQPKMAEASFQKLHVALAEKLSHIFGLYAGPLDYDRITPREAKDRHSGSFRMSEGIRAEAREASSDALQYLDLGDLEEATGGEVSPSPPSPPTPAKTKQDAPRALPET